MVSCLKNTICPITLLDYRAYKNTWFYRKIVTEKVAAAGLTVPAVAFK